MDRLYSLIETSGLFDSDFYLIKNPDVAKLRIDPLKHFISSGCAENRNPNPLFDIRFYKERNQDAKGYDRSNGLGHFIEFGAKEKRNPHPLFDVSFYWKNLPTNERERAGDNPLAHFINNIEHENSATHPLFDVKYYVSQPEYSNTAQEIPLVHYLLEGAAAGLKPHVLFDPIYYLQRYPDVKSSGLDALSHFVMLGAAEGRNPHVLFDTKFYRRQMAESEGDINELVHFCTLGDHQGNNPCSIFDTSFYKERYSQNIENGLSALEHYILYGAKKNYWPNRIFNPEYYLGQYLSEQHIKETPLEHYANIGHKLGLNPHPLFYSNYYVIRNPDLRWSKHSPLAHFFEQGSKNNLDPNHLFDSQYYKNAYRENNSFEHYLEAGYKINYSPNEKFDSLRYFKSTGCDEALLNVSPLEHCLYQRRKDARKIFNERQRSINTSTVPFVSIVLVSANNSYLVIDSLLSIWKYTDGISFETIVVDNGSEPHHLESLKTLDAAVSLIELGIDRGRGEAFNIGAEASRGKYLVFVDSGLVVKPNWLEPMLGAIENNEQVGVVGPQIENPDGSIQEMGCEIKDYVIRPATTEEKQSSDFYTVDCVSLKVMVLEKQEFLNILGFDLNYDPAFYEDADLCMKYKSKGLDSVIAKRSVVIDFRTNFGNDEKKNEVIATRNQKTFEHRWKESKFRITDRGFLPTTLGEEGSKCECAVGIYTPYPLVQSGGDKFILSLAQSLSDVGQPAIISDHPWSDIRFATQKSGLGIEINEYRLQTYAEAKVQETNLELFFSLGNSLTPKVRGLGKKNYFICQFPFPDEDCYSRERMDYLYDYSAVLFYSKFVQCHYLNELATRNLPEVKTFILSPPIKRLKGHTTKQKKILHVGRFFATGHQKKQLEMVRAFRDLISDGHLVDWEFHLVGSVFHDQSASNYFLQVEAESRNLPIFLHPNIGEEELEDLYRSSAIYWHATGLGTDESTSPWVHEHFGMSTVEAMGAGCVPIVIGTGGQKEIVSDQVSGFLWKTVEELKIITKHFANQFGAASFARMRREAEKRASDFSYRQFADNVVSIIGMS